MEGTDQTITELRKQRDLRTENVIIVEGETKDTLPGYHFDGELDLALLDGPHAYPLPQIEFAYLEEVAVRTAFFRGASAVERGPDGWASQRMNRHTILRYSWRDRLRRLLGNG
jgi:hypothetical protein